MKKAKRVIALMLFCVILISSMTAFAGDYDSKYNDTQAQYSDLDKEELADLEDSAEAGEILAHLIQFIKDYYIGGEVDTDMLVNAAISGIADSLDEYTAYYTKNEYEEYIKMFSSNMFLLGVIWTQADEDYPLVSEVTEGGVAEAVGIQAGDIIISINSENMKGIPLQDAIDKNVAKGNTVLSIELKREENIIEVETELEPVKVQTVYTGEIGDMLVLDEKVDNSKIGYMNISAISDGTAREFEQELNNLKADGKKWLILDLRGNLGGIVERAIEICKMIVPAGVIISSQDKQGERVVEESELENLPFEKMVVLTDYKTASAAEIIASALQDSGAAKIVGSKTYGKGVIQTLCPILDDSVLKMTTHEYFTRNGNKINKIGIMPDVYVDSALFLSESDEFTSSKVKKTLTFLGFQADSRVQIMNSIGRFQESHGLEVSRSLDQKTINELNLAVYQEMNSNDRTLIKGYEEIIK